MPSPARKTSKNSFSGRTGRRFRWRLDAKKILLGLLAVIALITLPVALWMVRQSQDNRGGAAFCSGAYNCSARCNDGHVTTDICPAYGAYGSCSQWAADACATRAGVKEMISDGGVGGTYNDGSASSGGSGYTCPDNSTTAVYCRNKPEGFEVQGTCTCRKTSKGCGCFTGTSGGGSNNNSGSSQVNASRCDNKSNPHEYCKSTFGDNNYCGLSGNNGSQYQCMPRRAREGSCNIGSTRNGAPYNGETAQICATGFKCEGNVCIPNRASGICSSHTDCSGSEFCNPNGLCIAKRTNGSSCTASAQCIGRCDNNKCVDCVNNGNCSAGNICRNNTCVVAECVNSSQCPIDKVCNVSSSVQTSTQGQCIPRVGPGQRCWLGDQCSGAGYQCLNGVCSKP